MKSPKQQTMKNWTLMLVIFAMCHWTHLFAQDSTGQADTKTTNEVVMAFNGVTGVWMPANEYRQYREDQRKGFTHFTNWKITEVQLIKMDSLYQGAVIDRDRYKENFELEKVSYEDQVALNTTLEDTNKDLIAENGRLRKKIRLLPWFTVGGFMLGAIVVAAVR